MVDSAHSGKRLAELTDWLGYRGRAEWVTPDAVSHATGCRQVVLQAFDRLGVSGVFGIRRPRRGDETGDLVPFVYVALADDDAGAQLVHRRVWSQGIVPFLLIVTPGEIWSCDASSFVGRDWRASNRRVAWPSGSGRLEDLGSKLSAISHLRSGRMRSSVRISTERKGPRGGTRVDTFILDGLRSLSTALTRKTAENGGLTAPTANKVLGAILYFYCLLDRGVITPRWLADRGHAFDPVSREPWAMDQVWRLFEDLDDAFNGLVFHIPRAVRSAVKPGHVNLIRAVLKHGSAIVGESLQGGLVDVDLSVVRTETLSGVYEMFFENQAKKAKEEDGAFYTPAYLVDHVVAKVDELIPVKSGTTVIDCSAGSGIFLVGAYRRMLERMMEAGDRRSLDLVTARDTLANCIFGIERNEDAVHVAAFSLFLTMLDYCDAGDELGRPDGEAVFPAIIGKSLLVRDLFDKKPLPDGFPGKFDVLLGNPPWQKVQVIGPQAVEALTDSRLRLDRRVDRDRAAELFFWTAYEDFLAEDGVFGMVLSAKSFLSPGSNKFPHAFARGVGVTGFTNLTHLRRKLFPGAEHPAIGAFGFRKAPKPHETIWVHYPLLSSLPLDPSGGPWCIVEDAADVDFHGRHGIATPEALFRALMLRAADRRVVTYLDDLVARGDVSTLAGLCEETDLVLGRGGPPKQTGLRKAQHFGTSGENNYVGRLGLPDPVSDANLFPVPPRHALTELELSKAKPPFSSLFAGDVVAIPRSFKRVDYVESRFGFNSSLVALYFTRDGTVLREDRKRLLKALARYLSSDFVRYTAALYGRMWMIDRRRLEVGDLKRLPVPIRSLDDERISEILAASDESLPGLIHEMLGLDEAFAAIVTEYATRRHNFENGRLPAHALEQPGDAEVNGYRNALAAELSNSLTHAWTIDISLPKIDKSGIATIDVIFRRKDREAPGGPRSKLPPSEAEAWLGRTQVAYLGADVAIVQKPMVSARWTIEQAIADGRRIVSAIVKRKPDGNGRVAA